MKRAPLTYRLPPWTKEQLARIREIERDYHVRAFGEELARVNLDMTKEERHRYLAWMRKTARAHGVKIGRSRPPYGDES
ncbi:MAG: hypothetical protein FJ398_05780 [Verrucomicrobia bacterium]|nr:hypothetical protein [Verrucomicrobiota bacterium]